MQTLIQQVYRLSSDLLRGALEGRGPGVEGRGREKYDPDTGQAVSQGHHRHDRAVDRPDQDNDLQHGQALHLYRREQP